MARDNVPTAVLDLDRPRTLSFTLGAARRFFAATGKRLLSADAEIDEAEDLGPLIWAMAAGEDPTLTLAQVEEAIYPGNLAAVSQIVADLLMASVPEAKAADPLPLAPATTPAPNPQPSISMISGPLVESTSDSPTPSSGTG